jgi:CspA family cold shock protein
MINGTIISFNIIKQYGFIQGDDGQDYFVHRTGILGAWDPNEGDKVTFKVIKNTLGSRAKNVEKL